MNKKSVTRRLTLRKAAVNTGKCSFLYHDATAPSGPGLIEVSLSHSDTPHSAGLLWRSDQPDAETSTWQNTTLTRHTSAPGDIRTQNPIKWVAADPPLRPCNQSRKIIIKIIIIMDFNESRSLSSLQTKLWRHVTIYSVGWMALFLALPWSVYSNTFHFSFIKELA